MAGCGPHALVLSVPPLSCCQYLAQDQVQPSSPTATVFLRQVLTGDPKLLLNTGLWPLLLLYSFLPSGVGNPEFLLLYLSFLPGEKKKKEKKSKQTVAPTLVLGFTCWTLTSAGLCLLSVWLTFDLLHLVAKMGTRFPRPVFTLWLPAIRLGQILPSAECPLSWTCQSPCLASHPRGSFLEAGLLPTCLGILSTQEGMAQQTLVAKMNDLPCLGAAHT